MSRADSCIYNTRGKIMILVNPSFVSADPLLPRRHPSAPMRVKKEAFVARHFHASRWMSALPGLFLDMLNSRHPSKLDRGMRSSNLDCCSDVQSDNLREAPHRPEDSLILPGSCMLSFVLGLALLAHVCSDR